ncbi:MAG: molybdate ABC transporter substrate-binding protein [Chloroflexi bacterium]|nr:MAG: molybdate ABC transporter substrate-binding protein [Chloroflexota bacterium]
MRAAFLLAALLTGCASAGPSVTPEVQNVTVFAGSSLTDAFTRAGNGFAKTNTRVRFTFNFGSSSTLATQITNGAPADVFASADEGNMQKVVDANLLDGAPAAFATNRLAIAVAPGNPKKIAALADLARSDVVLVLAAPTVPAGKYALDALRKAGVIAKPVSQEVDVRAVLNKVSLGEADAGIVYVTDVKSATDRVTGVDIPEQQQVVARYPIAVVKGSPKSALAHRFVDYLVSPDGQKILVELGFSKP